VFLRNVGKYQKDHTALQPRTPTTRNVMMNVKNACDQCCHVHFQSVTVTVQKSSAPLVMLLCGLCPGDLTEATEPWIRVGTSGFDSHQGRIFSLPLHPERLWGPPSLLSSGYRG
jgi:hypothetical protein